MLKYYVKTTEAFKRLRADQDGVVVVPRENAERLLVVCEEMEHAEHVARADIEAGRTMQDSYVSRSYYVKPAGNGG